MGSVATFDQLPAEQRAIIELVVARGRSYDALADVLQVSPQRVRELAREALVELSPRTGKRVDPEWRGQVADYMLGQQSNAESTATRAHLKRDETARTWALSLLDALDMLFENGNLPTVPDAEPAERAGRRGEAAETEAADGESEAEEERPRKRERERKGRARATGADRGSKREENGDGAAEGVAATRERGRERKRDADRDAERKRDRQAERQREGKRDRDAARERERKRERDKDRDEDKRDEKAPVAGRSVLSPAAQSALRRRRLFGALGAVALLAAIVVGVLALTGVFSGDDDGATSGGDSDSSAQTEGGGTETPAGGQGQAQGQPRVLGQVPLQAQNGVKAQGVAYLLEQGSQRVLAVTARLPPLPANQRRAAYNVWLYNSPKDAASIGAQFTNAKGAYQGVGPLPGNYEKYKFIDVSVQPFNNKTGHSGNSVLRGALADLKPVPPGQQPGAQGGAQQPQPGQQPQQPAP